MSDLYRKFENIVDEAIIEAYESGLGLFLEDVEDRLESLAMVEENGVESIIEGIVEERNLLKKLLS